MSDQTILIKRYPNRRYYARNSSKYVSLKEIEEMVQSGHTVEIRDSQTDEDMTHVVLTQILMDRHPEKMSLFPTDLLHFILRTNDVMSGFLGEYFRHSLTYLDLLRLKSPPANALTPMNWAKSWLDSISSRPTPGAEPPPAPEFPPTSELPPTSEAIPTSESAQLAQRLKQLEERLEQLESGEH
jgi:polyhydroxyalkanoate synthesis repressor PhaR